MRKKLCYNVGGMSETIVYNYVTIEQILLIGSNRFFEFEMHNNVKAEVALIL